MKREPLARRDGARHQRGLSLVTTLVLMLATLGLGVAVMGVNTMEERMIANTKDRDLALQAAEAALRDAEQDVAMQRQPDDRIHRRLRQRPVHAALAARRARRARLAAGRRQPARLRLDGRRQGAPLRPVHRRAAFPSVAEQPRYVIEKFSYLGTPAGESVVLGAEPTAPGVGYRITARGVGARPETIVVLQSIYATR